MEWRVVRGWLRGELTILGVWKIQKVMEMEEGRSGKEPKKMLPEPCAQQDGQRQSLLRGYGQAYNVDNKKYKEEMHQLQATISSR